METHKLNWENLEERNIKHKATKISKTCRMCSRCFGTVLSRENHEIQEHHFTASKRGKGDAPRFLSLEAHTIQKPGQGIMGCFRNRKQRRKKMERECDLRLHILGVAQGGG